jgi:hypothetical protein
MTVLDHPPTLREAVTIMAIAVGLVAGGYTAGIWHSPNFASRTALDQLEQRVIKIEQTHR